MPVPFSHYSSTVPAPNFAEIGDIFSKYTAEYQENHKLPNESHVVFPPNFLEVPDIQSKHDFQACESHKLPSESSVLPQKCLEVADIFRKYGPAYRESHDLTSKQKRVMGAIENCQTEFLGGHVYRCDHCGHEEKGYNSWLGAPVGSALARRPRPSVRARHVLNGWKSSWKIC